MVVPHAGTWIEILDMMKKLTNFYVVPHAGTWIEIKTTPSIGTALLSSFPTRERGLKSEGHKLVIDTTKSFPTRERGLKYANLSNSCYDIEPPWKKEPPSCFHF